MLILMERYEASREQDEVLCYSEDISKIINALFERVFEYIKENEKEEEKKEITEKLLKWSSEYVSGIERSGFLIDDDQYWTIEEIGEANVEKETVHIEFKPLKGLTKNGIIRFAFSVSGIDTVRKAIENKPEYAIVDLEMLANTNQLE